MITEVNCMQVAHIGKSVIGYLAFNERGELIASKLFPKDPTIIKEKLTDENPSELEDLKKQLTVKGLEGKLDEKGDAFSKSQFRTIALKLKYYANPVDLNRLIMEVSAQKTKEMIKSQVGKDKIAMQVVSGIDDLEKIVNQLSERLREWFGLHYPEFHVTDHAKYAELVAQYGKRENFPDAKTSMGVDFNEEDAKAVAGYAAAIKELYNQRTILEKYLDVLMKEVAPNTTHMLGAVIAARMISQAGGLERLAKMPSSTIQVLGAEKALFRHLKGQGKPPKHGLIFASPMINQAPREERGKVARILASKLTIAARADAFGGKDISAILKEDLDKKIKDMEK